MPQDEIYLAKSFGDKQIEVVKSYDATFARDAFDQMDEEALEFLGRSIDLGARYDPLDTPSPNTPEYADALWQEVEEGAREDWNHFSYFIVLELRASQKLPRYVSADWPSAEAFAHRSLASCAA
jgi:hypothetical protein